MVEDGEVDISRALTYPSGCFNNKYFLSPRRFALRFDYHFRSICEPVPILLFHFPHARERVTY